MCGIGLQKGHIALELVPGGVLPVKGEIVQEVQTAGLGLVQILAPHDGQRQVGVEFRGDFIGLVGGHGADVVKEFMTVYA